MSKKRNLLIVALAVGLFPAQPAVAKKYTVVTEPVVEGRVFLNGEFVGVAPVEVNLKLKKNQVAVLTAEKARESAAVSRRLEEKNLEAEQKRYDNGMSTSYQVLEIQEDLSAARSREVTSITSYRLALVSYYRAVGGLLEQSGVEIATPMGAAAE